MKKVFGVVVALLLAITLLPACGPGGEGGGEGGVGGGGGGEGEGGGGGGAPPSYTGFEAPAKGQWAEYVISSNGEEYHQKLECIGEDTVDGKTCTGFEMTMTAPQEGETIMQIWTEAATRQPVKYVMKMEGQVLCMDVSQSTYEPPEAETPSSYDPNLPNISYGTYTTPTGKTVNVAKFTVNGGEGWVSSQVPLGMVKAVDASGKATMYLYDFGTSGAHRDISKTEMENCMQMPGS